MNITAPGAPRHNRHVLSRNGKRQINKQTAIQNSFSLNVLLFCPAAW